MADPVFVVNQDDPSCGIKKKIIHAGKGSLPDYADGTKVRYVFGHMVLLIWSIIRTISVIGDQNKKWRPGPGHRPGHAMAWAWQAYSYTYSLYCTVAR